QIVAGRALRRCGLGRLGRCRAAAAQLREHSGKLAVHGLEGLKEVPRQGGHRRKQIVEAAEKAPVEAAKTAESVGHAVGIAQFPGAVRTEMLLRHGAVDVALIIKRCFVLTAMLTFHKAYLLLLFTVNSDG